MSAAGVDGRLVVGHYSAGRVTSFSLDDGIPREPTTITLEGSGPDISRQDHAYPHQVLDHDGLAVITDLGSDCLWWLHPTDLAVVRRQALAPGCGPRHAAALPGGRVAVSGELDATLVVVPASGHPVSYASSTRQPDGRIYPSDVLAHPAGLVVVANRNVGTLGLVDVTGPLPRLVDERDCGGTWPLHLALDGDTVAVAQRDDDVVVLIDIEPAARTLGPPGAVPVARPTWLIPR